MDKGAKNTTRETVFEIAAGYMGTSVDRLTDATQLREPGCDCVSVISERFGGVKIVAGFETTLGEVVKQIESQDLDVG